MTPVMWILPSLALAIFVVFLAPWFAWRIRRWWIIRWAFVELEAISRITDKTEANRRFVAYLEKMQRITEQLTKESDE